MPAEPKTGRDYAKEFVNGTAGELSTAINQDPNLDQYQKANARTAVLLGQILGNVLVDVAADWWEDGEDGE